LDDHRAHFAGPVLLIFGTGDHFGIGPKPPRQGWEVILTTGKGNTDSIGREGKVFSSPCSLLCLPSFSVSLFLVFLLFVSAIFATIVILTVVVFIFVIVIIIVVRVKLARIIFIRIRPYFPTY
jgi:hypothetical protein